MFYVILSVFCSVAVSVILKFARSKQVNHLQLIVWNYPVAVCLTYFILKPTLEVSMTSILPWHLYVPLAILLPSIFVCIALAIQFSGIVKTEIAMRLSLFIPLLAAFFLFKEQISLSKCVGIAVGFAAILCSIGWQKKQVAGETDSRMRYALLVFLGMGVIDVLFKQVALHRAVPYMTGMFFIFVMAMLVALLYLSYLLWVKKERFDFKAVAWGLLLGLFNFGNILFYMKAHQHLPDNPSIVFTGMNIGVILLGAGVGVFLFQEKLAKTNRIGLVLAIIAILIIAYL